MPEDHLKRKDEITRLLLHRTEPTLSPLLAQVENTIVEVFAIEQPAQTYEIAVVPRPIERLVERREALLPIQHEVRGRMTVEGRCAGNLARCEEETAPILDAKQATSRVVLQDALDQLLGGTWVPDEIALEVGQCHFAVMDALKKEPKLL